MILANETAYYFEKTENNDTLLFSWKPNVTVDVAQFRMAISEFAQLCLKHRPQRGVIDAQQLDQTGTGFAWLRGSKEGQPDSYDEWWAREILPVYVQAGLAKLAVATGDPNAPGEVPIPDTSGAFRMGYFFGLDDAHAW